MGLQIFEDKTGADRPSFIDVIVNTCSNAPDDWGEVEIHAYVARRDTETGEIVIKNAPTEEVE